jgi:hypothetical protein
MLNFKLALIVSYRLANLHDHNTVSIGPDCGTVSKDSCKCKLCALWVVLSVNR